MNFTNLSKYLQLWLILLNKPIPVGAKSVNFSYPYLHSFPPFRLRTVRKDFPGHSFPNKCFARRIVMSVSVNFCRKRVFFSHLCCKTSNTLHHLKFYIGHLSDLVDLIIIILYKDDF